MPMRKHTREERMEATERRVHREIERTGLTKAKISLQIEAELNTEQKFHVNSKNRRNFNEYAIFAKTDTKYFEKNAL